MPTVGFTRAIAVFVASPIQPGRDINEDTDFLRCDHKFIGTEVS